MSQTFSKVASFLKLRGKTIVKVMALLVIAAAIPFAIVDTFEKGRVYLFSAQFLEDLPQRLSGSGRLRFILQPLLAILLGVRGGLADAKAGNPLFSVRFAFRCRATKRVVAECRRGNRHYARHRNHIGHRVSTGPLPGSTSRCSFADCTDSYLHSLCTVQSTDESTGTGVGKKVNNIKIFLKFLDWVIH